MSSSAAFSPDHLHHLSPSDQLCYVHCNFCDTVLAVSVPCSSLFKTVTVRCGHCTNLLSVNMRGLLLPSSNQLHQLGHSFFSPKNLLEEIRSSPSNMLLNQPNANESFMPVRGVEELPKPPVANRAMEKRQRVPSAYNRFIKEEIQRIKAGNPDISHREAFSAAAKNMDDVISQAQTTKAALGSQRALFGDVQGKVKLLSDKFPIVRGLIGAIRRKRSRDTLILAAVIAACTLFLIIYWLSK